MEFFAAALLLACIGVYALLAYGNGGVREIDPCERADELRPGLV